MAAISTLQEDLKLFRSLMQAINVVQKEATSDQCCAQSSSQNYHPVFRSGVKRRRSEAEVQQAVVDEGSELDDEDEEDADDDDDDDDDDEESDESEYDEDDELCDSEEEDDDDDEEEEDFPDLDNHSSYSSESDTLFDYSDKEPPRLLSSPTRFLPPKSVPDAQSPHPHQQPLPLPTPTTSTSPSPPHTHPIPPPSPPSSLRCYDHGCNGRAFTTRSNLQRHRREKSRARLQCRCPRCGAVFSRTTARNTHLARGSCERIRRYSNGRARKGVGAGRGRRDERG